MVDVLTNSDYHTKFNSAGENYEGCFIEYVNDYAITVPIRRAVVVVLPVCFQRGNDAVHLGGKHPGGHYPGNGYQLQFRKAVGHRNLRQYHDGPAGRGFRRELR